MSTDTKPATISKPTYDNPLGIVPANGGADPEPATTSHGSNGGALPPTPPANPAPSGDALPDFAGKLRGKKARDKAEGRAGVRNQTVIPVQTPNKQWFFRAHKNPDMSVPVDILEIEGGEHDGLWFLDPDVEFPGELETYVKPAIITLCITSDGTLFFYLAKQTAKSPKESTRRCIREAKIRWIQQRWYATSKGYEFTYARMLRREPEWPDLPLNDLLEKAFGDRFIYRADHPAINNLLFPADEDGADYEPTGE